MRSHFHEKRRRNSNKYSTVVNKSASNSRYSKSSGITKSTRVSAKSKGNATINKSGGHIGTSGIKQMDQKYQEMRVKFNKDFKISTIGATSNYVFDGDTFSKTPNTNISGFNFSSNKGNYTKSNRQGEKSYKKKYISPRSKRDRSKKSSQNKSKDNAHPRKVVDRKYFDYAKHNESLNFYDTSKNSGVKGINISSNEADGRNKVSSKPQYGTENMSHIIALLNDKKNYNQHTK